MSAYPPLPWPPPPFPPTTRERVLAESAAAPPATRAAFEKFLTSQVTGNQAANYLNAWLNVAWNALVLVGVGDKPGVYQRLDAERATFDFFDWNTFGEGSSTVTMKRFFDRWKGVLDDFRHNWDVRDPAKRALRARLAMIGDQPIDEETRLEVQRFATWANQFAKSIQASIEEQRALLLALIQARKFDLDDNLRISAELIGAGVAAVVVATMNAAWSVVAGTVHGLTHGLGIGMTLALVGAGLLVLGWFALPVIAPLIGASRALRRSA